MKNVVTILLVEDKEGHARLVEKNLRRAGMTNPISHMEAGEDALDLLFERDACNGLQRPSPLLMLLDLRLPGIDGKQDSDTKATPGVILTTTGELHEIKKCYESGCNVYVERLLEYQEFSEATRRLGLLLSIVAAPNGDV